MSADFAVAFAVSRPLRKVRLPVELAVAAGLTRVCPILATVKLSSITNAFLVKRDKPSFLEKSAKSMNAVVDKYGIAYLLASRLTGVSIVLALYHALRMGVDLSPLLSTLGMSESTGSTLGSWAAAVVLSSTMYPLTLSLTGVIVPWIARR